MKLNPPASSSDLDTARAVARRLHRRAQGHERAADEVADPPAPWEPVATPASPAAPPEPEPLGAAPPRVSEPSLTEAGPFDTPDEPAFEGESLFDAGTLDEPPPPPASPVEPPDSDPASAEAGEDDELGALTDPGFPAPDEPPAGGVSAEDLVGEPDPGWGDDGGLGLELDSPEAERAPDDLITAPPPAWDDIADSCMLRARAHGAMIVDPTGQVMTARGEWPEPGPEAIGGRLVSMMEKTLHDAPTRSVSAPLAGEHLTAWRVPIAEGYLTVVFMAESPLGNETRDGVDREIRQALGE